MRTRINVAELLKNCPKGMKLNCSIFDNLYFDYIDDSLNDLYPIHCYIKQSEAQSVVRFTKYGTYTLHPAQKCVIFPKGKNTWDGFVPPVEFKDGDIVATNSGAWIGIMEKEEHDGKVMSVYCVLKGSAGLEIYHKGKGKWCFSRLATEEEKQRLFKAIEDNGYKWNAEKKCLEKKDITIQDLYNWAKDRNCLDYKIRIQYRDEGGDYPGSDKEVYLDVNEEDKTIIL